MPRKRDAQSRRYGVILPRSFRSNLQATRTWKQLCFFSRALRTRLGRWQLENASTRESTALVGLASEVARCRWESAYILSRSSQRSSEAIKALDLALSDPVEFVRWQAATALAAQEAGRAFPALARSLEDADERRRASAAEALGLLGGEAAGLALVKHVGDPSAEVRSAVAEAIGQINDPTKAPILVPLLKDQDPDVRRAAAAALGFLRAHSAQGALKDALMLPGQPVLVRRAVAAAIAAAPHPEAQSALVATLRDPDEQVRAYSAEALGQVGDEKAYDALAVLRTDETRVLSGSVGERVRAAMSLIERRGRKGANMSPANGGVG